MVQGKPAVGGGGVGEVDPPPLLRTLFLHRAGLSVGGAESLKTSDGRDYADNPSTASLLSQMDLGPEKISSCSNPELQNQGKNPSPPIAGSGCHLFLSIASECNILQP